MGGCLSSIEEADSERGSGSGLPTSNVISANGDLQKYTVPVTVSQVLHMEFPTLPPSPSSSSSNSISNSNWNSAKFFVCSSDLLYYDEYIQALNGEYQLQPDQLYFVLPASKLQYPITASDMAALAAKASLALALSHSLHKSSSNSSSSSYNKPSSSSSSSSSSIRQGRHHRARARQNNMARISPFFLEEVNINNNTSTSKSTSTSKRNNHHQTVPSSSNSDGKHYYYEMVEEERDELMGFSDKFYPEEALGVAGGRVLSSSVSEKNSMRRIRSKQQQKNRYRYSGGAKVAVRSFRIQLTTIHEGSVLHFY
ncbi:hypothetical protein ACSBR1_000026 [Camellia fascicularis]